MTARIRQLQLIRGLFDKGHPVIAGGSVISNGATHVPNVFALGFVSGTAPDVGESAADLTSRFRGSTLGDKLTRCRSPTATRASI